MSRKNTRVSSSPSSAIVVPHVGTNGDDPRTFSDKLLTAMLSFRDGDFSVRMPSNITGVDGKIADTFNNIVSFSERRSKETVRVSGAEQLDIRRAGHDA